MSTELKDATKPRLSQELRSTDALTFQSLGFAMLAAFVGGAITAFAGSGPIGTLLATTAAPLISALVTTHGRGHARRVSIVVLTALAVTVTVTGVTSAELLSGRALFNEGEGTFVPRITEVAPRVPESNSSTISTKLVPDIAITNEADCSSGSCSVDVTSTGTAPLKITSVEINSAYDEYEVTNSCVGTLDVGESCTIEVSYSPSNYGNGNAELTVNQNLPGDASYVSLMGAQACPGTETTATRANTSDCNSTGNGSSETETPTTTETTTTAPSTPRAAPTR